MRARTSIHFQFLATIGLGLFGVVGCASSSSGSPASDEVDEDLGAAVDRAVDASTVRASVVDVGGAVHTAWGAAEGLGAFYAVTRSDEANLDGVAIASLETDSAVESVHLALDAAGRPRLVLSAFRKIYVASCDEGCERSEHWTVQTVLEHAFDVRAEVHAFRLDENGFPRFVVNRHATVDDVSNAANEHADETITMALDETGAWRATNSTAQ